MFLNQTHKTRYLHKKDQFLSTNSRQYYYSLKPGVPLLISGSGQRISSYTSEWKVIRPLTIN